MRPLLDPWVERELHLSGVIVQAEVCAAEVAQGDKTVLVGYLFQPCQRDLVQNGGKLLHKACFRYDDRSVWLDADKDLSQTGLALGQWDVQRNRTAGGIEARQTFGIARGARLAAAPNSMRPSLKRAWRPAD